MFGNSVDESETEEEDEEDGEGDESGKVDEVDEGDIGDEGDEGDEGDRIDEGDVVEEAKGNKESKEEKQEREDETFNEKQKFISAYKLSTLEHLWKSKPVPSTKNLSVTADGCYVGVRSPTGLHVISGTDGNFVKTLFMKETKEDKFNEFIFSADGSNVVAVGEYNFVSRSFVSMK